VAFLEFYIVFFVFAVITHTEGHACLWVVMDTLIGASLSGGPFLGEEAVTRLHGRTLTGELDESQSWVVKTTGNIVTG